MTVPLHTLTDTWSDSSVIFAAIKMNVTDGASNAASKLLDLQIATVSKFSVNKAGVLAWGAVTQTPTTSMFSDGLLQINKDFIVRRNAGVGSAAEIGTKTIAPGGSETDTLYRYSTFVVNDAVNHTPVFGEAGIAGYFGVVSLGNTTSAENPSGVNSFAGLDINASANVENLGDFNGGFYLGSFFGTNFSTAANIAHPWYYVGIYVGLYDYGGAAAVCATSYSDFLGLVVESVHRGTGAATNVVGVQVAASSGQSGSITTGACTNLIGVEVLNNGFYENIANASGIIIHDWSGIGASTTNYNLKSEGAASVNLISGTIRFGTGTNASPTNGDLWFDGTNLKFRTGGVTKTVTVA